jgi:peroxiredoxin
MLLIFRIIIKLLIVLFMALGAVWLFLQANSLLTSTVRQDAPTASLPTTLPQPVERQATALPFPSPTKRVIIGPFVGQQAPGFSLSTLEGEQVSLESYRGKVVLLNFWASWCIPCKEEMPLIEAAYKKYQDRGLVVLGINMTDLDTRKDVETFVQETGVTFPILLDESGSVSNEYRIISIPTTFFVDSSGIIRHFQLGAMTEEQLGEYLDEMLPNPSS